MHDVLGPRIGFDLVAALGSAEAVVRPEPEIVHGIECTVVDIVSQACGLGVHRVWVDAANGAMPVRHRQFSRGTGDLVSERVATEFVAVRPGIALPTAGMCTHFGVRSGEAAPSDIVHAYSVRPLEDGRYFQSQPLPPSTFDLAESLPADVCVRDLAT